MASFGLSGTVRVVLDPAAIARLSSSPDVVADLLRRGRNVQSRAKVLCPVNHGDLRASIVVELTTVAGKPVIRIGSRLKYALPVHEGTGIYGPTGAPITPRRAKVLRFKPAGASEFVFAPSVKGVKGRPFLREALPAAAH